MNNKGQATTWIFLGLMVVLVLGVLGGGYYFFFGAGAEQTTVGDLESPVKCADSTGILTVNAVSKLEGASDPSGPTITCGSDGDKVKTSVTSGTTTFPVGADLTCLVSKADYIDTSFTSTMACGGLNEQVEMYYATSDNPAVKITDPNNADAQVTDAIGGGATNLSDLTAGGTIDFDVEFKGTSTEGTGNMIYVIEFPASSNTNITKVTMGNLKKTNVPQLHAAQNAGSELVAFEVPNIEGAVKKTYSVIATLSTTGDLAGGVYTDVYAGQSFIDDDGYISSGVEDSDGTAKYENTLDYDFSIA